MRLTATSQVPRISPAEKYEGQMWGVTYTDNKIDNTQVTFLTSIF